MQLNVLNDLAEAMKALDGKKGSMQHAAERVERPGESQEALDGKKTHTTVWQCDFCVSVFRFVWFRHTNT